MERPGVLVSIMKQCGTIGGGLSAKALLTQIDGNNLREAVLTQNLGRKNNAGKVTFMGAFGGGTSLPERKSGQ